MTRSSPTKSSSFSTSALLKSKFRSSIDRLKKLFNMNRWSRLPTKSLGYDDDEHDDEYDDEFDESQSLMASHSSLPPATKPIHSFKSSPKPVARANDKQVKRVIKELIDDEIPLIKI